MILIRACEGFDELEACVQLQVETWGVEPSETTPRKTFLLAQKIGGQVIGAFNTGLPGANPQGGPESLVGFAFSLPGVKASKENPLQAPQPYLHSHMLAVRSEWRNQGVGAQLKREQRLEALSRGIRRMEWTFDPLEIKNSFLNIHKLGVTVREYRVNFYGVSSSRLQGGLPTDRLLAEWELDSPRVEAILEGRTVDRCSITEHIHLPASIYQWKASEADRERALAVQLENRGKFQEAFSQGLAVLDFSLDKEGNGIYELGFPAQVSGYSPKGPAQI